MTDSAPQELIEIECETWEEFKSQLAEFLSGNAESKEGDFVFRGQGDAEWSLSTSFDRAFGQRVTGSKAAVESRRTRSRLLKQFREQMRLASLADSTPERSAPEPLWTWAIGQHYGLPTPLLDWTISPYIAAFFALESALAKIQFDQEGEIEFADGCLAIFALNKRPLRAWEEMGVTFCQPLSLLNERIRPQLGLFTMTDGPVLEDCVLAYCSKHDVAIDRFLTKFTLPITTSIEALQDLSLMDISPRRIYAGITGAAAAASLKVKLLIYQAMTHDDKYL